jgi:8-oxo-dGTP pyrophosphatase MutT (NUDIX family)
MSEAPKPASTVLLVRDAGRLEVLMVRRSSRMAFGASAWVFPGGKVAPCDADPEWRDHVSGAFSDEQRSLRIAAARETFEESGILLARRGADGGPPAPDVLAAFMGQRTEIEANPERLLKGLREAGLILAIDQLAPFAHWITPSFEPRRFDTHFFLAPAPEGQETCHDGREAVDHGWVAPSDVLAARLRGEVKLMFPTRLNLQRLAQARDSADALSRTQGRLPVTVEPVLDESNGRRVLRIPAEAGYGLTEEDLDNVMA